MAKRRISVFVAVVSLASGFAVPAAWAQDAADAPATTATVEPAAPAAPPAVIQPTPIDPELRLPQGAPEALRDAVLDAAANVRPALVRIQVVSADYQEGREVKYSSAGSGAIITPEGHVITNHHVAGHATRLLVTLATKEEVSATLVGTDPLTDIAVIKLENDGTRQYPVAVFGDSSLVEVGDRVLAMGSPMALSQSVTLGIVSNVELVMPRMFGRFSRLTLDGEDVGAFVRWIGHDAAIYPGNSGGPLVDLEGKIIGINEISMSLGGAIPSNVARAVAEEIIKNGKIRRAWLGIEVQPRLKNDPNEVGILVSGAMEGSPGAEAGIQSGDLLIKLAGEDVNVRFDEELPAFNRMAASLEIGKPVEAVVLRDGQQVTLTITPTERGEVAPKQTEIKQWGLTCRNLSYVISKEMKRDDTNGVLVTSVRPGGPAGEAKPKLEEGDVIVKVNDTAINNLDDLTKMTEEITRDQKTPVPVLVEFERNDESNITVVRVGIKELDSPAREVKKAWLPVKTQVITRELAEQLGKPDVTGFRITDVYANSTAEKAGLQVGDLITHVDDQKLTASELEHYEELPTLIRQYKIGTTAELTVLRDGQETKVPVELVVTPTPPREMKKYRNEQFEFTTRDITYFDKADQEWDEGQQGVLVEEVTPGSWAAIGGLYVGDLIQTVNGTPVSNVDSMEKKMDEIAEAKPRAVVIKVLRGIHTLFLEIEPNWEKTA
jgi:serine protease Do